ncbi:MAG: alpha-1,4-glucan--maltose-1-phosphate maltosyltransferase [Propionibacteriaceae bacterium]|nr:alpha-1,4-glucan--maltose-1-phosphate maltosyltransferase [Propionibacteriaceae bacterium]
METEAPEVTAPAPPAVLAPGFGRIPVAKVEPVIDHGAYPAKAVVGESFPIRARVFREGHDRVNASAILTDPNGQTSRHDLTQIWPEGLDIWEVWVTADQVGDWQFRVEGWSDPWATWVHNAEIKLTNNTDVNLMYAEGYAILEQARQLASDAGQRQAADKIAGWSSLLTVNPPTEAVLDLLHDPDLTATMATWRPREFVSPTPDYGLTVDRQRALFSAWYEFFPRSQGAQRHDDGSWQSGTFDSSHERLEAAAAMGFDIIYLPPIHPIGSQFRKGPNNTLEAGPFDPGSPWAIGAAAGGHDAVHPDLGDLAAFDRFTAKARELGLEVAIDFALQTSPDHPWVSQHPEWLTTRLDGTIAYAENPPKKYQDIYPLNFDKDPQGLYDECYRLIEFWIGHGVTVFRVDNPHTKPLTFWDWLLTKVHRHYPDVLFLAEAFTRPEMMQALGQIGFHQSYTYFTWRNSKWELETYLTELSRETAAFYRPNFFVNTPDINPFFLHGGQPAAFAIRAILAATLSPSWGVYSGFELFEHQPLKLDSEEYLNSEKYEYRPRDFNAEPNLNLLLTTLNLIRRTHPALQQLRRIDFHQTSNDQVIAFSKQAGNDRVVVIVNLDPDNYQQAQIDLNFAALGLDDRDQVSAHDTLTGDTWSWGRQVFVSLGPAQPAHIVSLATE